MGTLEAIGIIVGVVSGVSGFVLGILNYVPQRDTSRPRLVVRPRIYDIYRTSTGELSDKAIAVMEILNVGQIPVMGSSIGFEPRWRWAYEIIRFLPARARDGAASFMHKREQGKAGFFPMPIPMDGPPWVGRELGSQQRATLRFDLDGLPEARKLGRAHATTAVGDTFRASRRDMRIFAHSREAARLKAEASP